MMRRPWPLRIRRLLVQGQRGWRRAAAGCLVAVVAALTVGGLLQARVDTGIGSFLPSGDPAYRALEEKARSFGGDPVVVLLEGRDAQELVLEADNLPRLLRLEGRLAKLPEVAAVYGPATVLNQTAKAAQNLLAEISGRRDTVRNAAEKRARQDGASEAEANAAAESAVAKFDRRYGSLLVLGLPAGLPTLHNPQFVAKILFTDQGMPKPQWQFVLPNDHTVAILIRPREELDQAAAARLADAVRNTVEEANLPLEKVTVTGVPVLTSAMTERARAEMAVLGALAVLAVGAIFFLVPWSRRRRSRLRPLVAALLGTALTVAIFGWLGQPLSLGAVAFLPIMLGIGSDFPFYLSQPGHRRRALVAAIAAAAGFGALTLSPLPFVRELGVAVAMGIVLTVGVALAMRRLLGVVEPIEPGGKRGEKAHSVPTWKRAVTLAVAIVVAGLGWAALPRLDIEARPDQLARGLPELDDARYAERILGSAGEVSIVLRGANVLDPEALRWSRQAEEIIARGHGDRLHPILTLSGLLAFLGDDPTADQIAAGVRLLPSYLTSSVVRSDSKLAVMAFGIELTDLEQQRALLAEVRRELPRPPDGLEIELVGLQVAAVQGLDAVADGRVVLNMVGIAAAGLVLLVGLRRRTDAARAVLAVLLATGWVLVLVWSVAGSLNPLTVAIGSLTTATSCEFVTMLSAASRARARRLGRSVGVAALAGSAGYLVLGLSGIAILREFGVLLAASVALSYAAAIVVRWALPPQCGPARSDQGRPQRASLNKTEVAV